MKVRCELTKKYVLISLMKIFGRTKNLRNILEVLKSNIGIFKRVIYLFNPFKYLVKYPLKKLEFSPFNNIIIFN